MNEMKMTKAGKNRIANREVVRRSSETTCVRHSADSHSKHLKKKSI